MSDTKSPNLRLGEFGSEYTPNDTTRVVSQLWMVTNLKNLHISKEIAQGTIDTTAITESHFATTLCGQTWTSGCAYTDKGNTALKTCKACAAKAGK